MGAVFAEVSLGLKALPHKAQGFTPVSWRKTPRPERSRAIVEHIMLPWVRGLEAAEGAICEGLKHRSCPGDQGLDGRNAVAGSPQGRLELTESRSVVLADPAAG